MKIVNIADLVTKPVGGIDVPQLTHELRID